VNSIIKFYHKTLHKGVALER